MQCDVGYHLASLDQDSGNVGDGRVQLAQMSRSQSHGTPEVALANLLQQPLKPYTHYNLFSVKALCKKALEPNYDF